MTPTQILGLTCLCAVLGLIGSVAVFGGKSLIYLGKIAGDLDNLKELPAVIDEMREEFQGINTRVTKLETRYEAEQDLLRFPRVRSKQGDPA